MNKYERILKGKAKFKKRLENNGFTSETFEKAKKRGIILNVNCYRTTGTPCSCYLCSPGKFKEKSKYKYDKNKHFDSSYGIE